MKKTRPFCLFLIMVLALVLCGCGKTGADPEADGRVEKEDSVRLSNIRFYQDDLSEDERAMMERIINMLKHAGYRPRTQEFVVSNTTGEELDNIQFILLVYNRDGTLIGNNSFRLENWPADGRAEISISSFLGSGSDIDSLDVAASYIYGSSYYQTMAEPVSFEEEEERTVELLLTEDAPFSLSLKGSSGSMQNFTVSSVRCIMNPSNGQYYVEMLITKDSGPANDSVSMDWRIIREKDRTVMLSENALPSYMHEGEKYLYRSGSLNIEPGSYLFEILK